MAGSVIAAQLYTVREFTKTPADIAETIRKVAAIGYEAVQLSALGEHDPAEVRKVCDGEGVTICATHTSYAMMRDERRRKRRVRTQVRPSTSTPPTAAPTPASAGCRASIATPRASRSLRRKRPRWRGSSPRAV